tara:strand:- start:54 stop:614 length:561 start_codon:yes stop_codon:yes gene_type:complete
LDVRKIIKVKTDKYFIKTYPKTVLLESLHNIECRLKLIKSVIQYFFEYEWTDSSLILKSQIFNGNHHKLNKTQLIELAKYLDSVHSKGGYHGDIHIRNIFVKNNVPILVDWEPCTVQLINSKRIIKSHSKSIAIKDRKNKKISSFTDKKGFLRLISKEVFNQLSDTNEMENLNCQELLDFCCEKLR